MGAAHDVGLFSQLTPAAAVAVAASGGQAEEKQNDFKWQNSESNGIFD